MRYQAQESKMNDTYEAVIGLEVHSQLATASKAFSADDASFVAEPNSHVDPLTLGHPGTLPVMNERAVLFTVRMGLATHSTIHSPSIFARKHYFYPDLPKGYQISQYDSPICSGGFVEIPDAEEEGATQRIRLTRIHMEEDAGKSIHVDGSDLSLLDYNRSGVPLMEIVTEPDIRTPRDAYETMRKIRQIVRYLGICDGNMEEGSLRCDANVSIRVKGTSKLGQKTEIKNLNSFRFLEKALTYEIERQIILLDEGKSISSETRLWDDEAGRTRTMRSKEEAHDYRYFPDPDLPPVIVFEETLEKIRFAMPVLPDQRVEKYCRDWKLPLYDAQVLTAERVVADYFEQCVTWIISLDTTREVGEVAKAVSNFMMTHVLRSFKERELDAEQFSITPERLAGLIRMRLQDRISSTGAQVIFETMLDSASLAETIAEAQNLIQVKDSAALLPFVEQVIREHSKNVDMYLSGKTGLIGFFIGRVMKLCPGSPDPRQVRALLEEKFESMRP
jgi:aspartyl-tRNA(Asn)/glutamyl-tRNA(Gln) amidotransferase subunit B